MLIRLRTPLLILLLLVSVGCSTTGPQHPTPFEAMEELYDSPRDFTRPEDIDQLYHSRSWLVARKLKIDPIEFGNISKAPVQHARTKILGTSREDAVRSLAAKIWMIEHAQHTVDITYYIFKRDLVGYAILGALCNAVKRGVDIRIMVDSLGSFHMTHSELKALESCAEEAGFIHDANGHPTTHKARVQSVIINALTSPKSWVNRRSHDKLLIVDGDFPGKDMIITGGRNISVDYYGISNDGSSNPDTYVDLEILLRSSEEAIENDDVSVGEVSGIYYTLLFLHKGNRRIRPAKRVEDDVVQTDPYFHQRRKAQDRLAFLKSLPKMQAVFAEMPTYLSEGFNDSQVRIAHELGNLTSKDVVANATAIKSQNENSIGALLWNFMTESAEPDQTTGTFRIISPYLFIAKYKDKEGNLIWDGAKELKKLLAEYPDKNLEVITNSALTSDNFFTQSIIDMDMAPRLLLSPELREAWLSGLDSGEFNPEVVESEEWKKQVNNPRIKIYQTGKIDSVLLGGTEHYGKLHAKFIFDDEFGFVGTSNFDYRSRLYNNEMGFYFLDPSLSMELSKSYGILKAMSYRWGSPEWLEMRKTIIESGTFKGYTTKTQRGYAKFLKSTGLVKQF